MKIFAKLDSFMDKKQFKSIDMHENHLIIRDFKIILCIQINRSE